MAGNGAMNGPADSLRIDARWPEIDALLDLVLDQPEDQRQVWLQAHGDDAELRALVQSLLDADSLRGAGIQAHADGVHGWLDARAAELPQVPGYRVLRLIGEGGMASVFLAERLLGETVQRVALKRLRLNVYDAAERRRFEREHRLLARLEHPDIAHLLDAGIAPDGVPWFAMEYVEGEPLVAWCDARRLGTDARLALFADICAAIQHAHQHLVVHRDLKPSNILVDDAGHVKLLDFGIGRLLESDTDRPDGTRTELRRLTPGYAAPEQYAGHASTATDVYALGVILVELLSGRKPQASREPGSDPLRNATVTREAADARASSPRVLERLLAGDLGAIARKATRSEPALRYASAQALADELAALRTGRPVAARRGDWRYRAACFVRRNKTAVAASAVIAVTLVVTTAISLYQAREARAQTARAQAVQGFVENMLGPLRTGVPAAHVPRLDEVLAQGVHDLERRRQRDPAVYSELLTMFANTYDRMGDVETARTLAERAYRQSADAFGAADPRTARALALRGRMHARFGDRERAYADLEAAQARLQRSGDDTTLAMVLDDLGALELEGNNAQRAAELFAEGQQQRLRALGPTHPDIAIGYANLAYVRDTLGDNQAALALYDKAYQHCLLHEGPDTRQAALYLGNIGQTKCKLGYWHDGARDYVRSLALFDKLGQNDHPDRFHVLQGGCSVWVFLDELQHAGNDCERALAMAERLYGRDHEQYDFMRLIRIKLLAAQGRLREAHADADDIHARFKARLQGNPDRLRRRLSWLGRFMSDVQVVEGDYPALRDSLLDIVARDSDSWVGTPLAMARLALACAHAPDSACPTYLVARADERLATSKFRDHPWRIEAELMLARLALEQRDIAQAERRLAEVARIAALPPSRLRPDHRWLAEARILRGDAFSAQGDDAAAQREWQAAEAVFAARYAADHPFRRGLAERLHADSSR
jgi:tetratricopeptide (TPR) repeat protein